MSKTTSVRTLLAAAVVAVTFGSAARASSLWELANENKGVLQVATLFTAQNVRDYLDGTNGLVSAGDWCKESGVTHVFIETFRDGYTADERVLRKASDWFAREGFDVSGCVTTTKVGKTSTGWDAVSCYTDEATQEKLQEIFEYAASIFDEIMIDDFLFTDCECDKCQEARGGQTWAEYRCELMGGLSRDRILAPARAVNANVKIIIKYPQWYDNFHNRGYDVLGQTADFDRIWVGTETRDFRDARWGGKVQYEAYYIMRWLGGIGGVKCGGGWFDPYGTTEDTYLEQARQTVLGGADEMLLFCYGSLLRETGPANVGRLQKELPGLFELAKLVRGSAIRGISAPKPPSSDAGGEEYVFDFAGMLGLPLVPGTDVDPGAKAAFFSEHSLADSQLSGKIRSMLKAGKPVLITDGLAGRLSGVDTKDKNLTILEVGGAPRSLLALDRVAVQAIRDKMLAPFGLKLESPVWVGLYLIGDDVIIVENFSEQVVDGALIFKGPVETEVKLKLPADAVVETSAGYDRLNLRQIAPRTLVAVTYKTGM